MQHAKKIVLSQPFFLTFVVFPWFNNVITVEKIGFSIDGEQYSSDSTLFSVYGTDFDGPLALRLMNLVIRKAATKHEETVSKHLNSYITSIYRGQRPDLRQ